MLTPAASRKRAQRAFPELSACERCGSTSDLQRHHPTLADALSVVILCQPCHAREHARLGTWGQGSKPTSTCVVCGKAFTASSHRKRAKVCSPECLVVRGRQAANKRWHTASTDLGPSEMRSSRKSSNGSADASSKRKR